MSNQKRMVIEVTFSRLKQLETDMCLGREINSFLLKNPAVHKAKAGGRK